MTQEQFETFHILLEALMDGVVLTKAEHEAIEVAIAILQPLQSKGA